MLQSGHARLSIRRQCGLLGLNRSTAFCVSALEKALTISQPEVFNTDQGAQYTSEAFTGRLKADGVRISMDGRGRVYDNVFAERLWRTVKYEKV